MKQPCSITVNGEAHDVLVSPSTTLLHVLRDTLELTGTKRGCNHGVCGACTVRIGGELARSCLMLALDVGEQPVVTVEGVADAAGPSRVQQALIDAGAIQCGFCSPGFVMALTQRFERNAHPGRDEIRSALSGHLCRCSGYVKIVEAAERLAGAGRDG